MSFLDKLAYESTKLLLWSGVVLWIGIIGVSFYNLFEKDEVIGYTHHGVPVLKSELEKESE
jgi:hypothetical protein